MANPRQEAYQQRVQSMHSNAGANEQDNVSTK